MPYIGSHWPIWRKSLYCTIPILIYMHVYWLNHGLYVLIFGYIRWYTPPYIMNLAYIYAIFDDFGPKLRVIGGLRHRYSVNLSKNRGIWNHIRWYTPHISWIWPIFMLFLIYICLKDLGRGRIGQNWGVFGLYSMVYSSLCHDYGLIIAIFAIYTMIIS